jgi:hypothetical protein
MTVLAIPLECCTPNCFNAGFRRSNPASPAPMAVCGATLAQGRVCMNVDVSRREASPHGASGLAVPAPYSGDSYAGARSIVGAAQSNELQVTALGVSHHHGMVQRLTRFHYDLKRATRPASGLGNAASERFDVDL